MLRSNRTNNIKALLCILTYFLNFIFKDNFENVFSDNLLKNDWTEFFCILGGIVLVLYVIGNNPSSLIYTEQMSLLDLTRYQETEELIEIFEKINKERYLSGYVQEKNI